MFIKYVLYPIIKTARLMYEFWETRSKPNLFLRIFSYTFGASNISKSKMCNLFIYSFAQILVLIIYYLFIILDFFFYLSKN